MLSPFHRQPPDRPIQTIQLASHACMAPEAELLLLLKAKAQFVGSAVSSGKIPNPAQLAAFLRSLVGETGRDHPGGGTVNLYGITVLG